MRYFQIAALCAVTPIVVAGAATPPKPFAIQNVTLSQYEDGPPIPRDFYFVPGDTVFLSFQIAGYKPTGDDEPAVKLEYHVEAKDPAGVLIAEPGSARIAAVLAQEDKNWMPKGRQTIVVPPFAPSGTYHISIAVKDEVASAETRKDVDFAVRARDVEPSETLVIRNFHFYRGEEDKSPLEVAAYKPGDAVWIKFDITGFKFGEHNAFEVGYGITVLRPNGETTFQQAEAAVEREQSFYPRRYVPAVLSLSLPKDVRPGQYTVILGAQDKVGDQKAEARQTFTVEP